MTISADTPATHTQSGAARPHLRRTSALEGERRARQPQGPRMARGGELATHRNSRTVGGGGKREKREHTTGEGGQQCGQSASGVHRSDVGILKSAMHHDICQEMAKMSCGKRHSNAQSRAASTKATRGRWRRPGAAPCHPRSGPGLDVALLSSSMRAMGLLVSARVGGGRGREGSNPRQRHGGWLEGRKGRRGWEGKGRRGWVERGGKRKERGVGVGQGPAHGYNSVLESRVPRAIACIDVHSAISQLRANQSAD